MKVGDAVNGDTGSGQAQNMGHGHGTFYRISLKVFLKITKKIIKKFPNHCKNYPICG